MKYGYARGYEALQYVENIRRYYSSIINYQRVEEQKAQEQENIPNDKVKQENYSDEKLKKKKILPTRKTRLRLIKQIKNRKKLISSRRNAFMQMQQDIY